MFVFSLILLGITFGMMFLGQQNPLLKKAAVIPAVFAILLGVFQLQPAEAPSIEELVSTDRTMGQLLANRILADQPAGGAVAVVQLRPGDPDIVMQTVPEAQLEGLREILGENYQLHPIDATEVGKKDTLRFEGNRIRTCRDYVHMLDSIPDLVAVVSFAGLPVDVYNLPKTSLPPFYVLLDDVFQEAWREKLPAGVVTVVGLREDHFKIRESAETAREEFQQKYFLHPELGTYENE